MKFIGDEIVLKKVGYSITIPIVLEGEIKFPMYQVVFDMLTHQALQQIAINPDLVSRISKAMFKSNQIKSVKPSFHGERQGIVVTSNISGSDVKGVLMPIEINF